MIELGQQRIDEGHPAPDYEGLPKLTFGTRSASGGALKSGCSLKPKIPAVTFDGNWRRDVLYACTRSLYRMRSTARRFSVPDSSSINRLNEAFERSSG